IDAVAATRVFHQDYAVRKFFVVYWALYLAYASSINVLLAAVRRIYADMSLSDLRDVLFCLKVVGWIDRQKYSNKEYYFALGNGAPLEYRCSAELEDKDILGRRLRVRQDFEATETLPAHIKRVVADRRAESR